MQTYRAISSRQQGGSVDIILSNIMVAKRVERQKELKMRYLVKEKIWLGVCVMFVTLYCSGTLAYAATCATCHAPVNQAIPDIRPVDAAWRNISSGGFKGSHAKHMPAATTAASACTSCHGASVTSYSTRHRDGTIQVDAAVTYSKGASFSQSGNPLLGSCSTASCHANPYGTGLVVTPTWGVTVSSCAACHGSYPITASGPATGSHVKHSNTGSVCTDCHAAGTSATGMPATGHIDGNIDVTGGYPANRAKHAAGSGYTSCATASCHANPYGTGSVATPTWGVTSSQCTACHSAYPITASGPATGTHIAHMSLAGAACTQCHAAGTSATVAPASGHVDGNIDVTVGYPANVTKHLAGTGYSSCSTSSCHGTVSPVWGANTTNNSCTKCHGTGTVTVTASNREVIAPVGGTLTGTGQVSNNAKVGAHSTHLKYLNGFSNYSTVDYRCETCHGTLPTTGNHANGSSAPQFQKMATRNGNFTANYTAGSCAVYCHNPASATGGTLTGGNSGTNTTPSWTDAAYLADGGKTQANCDKCHLSPNGSRVISTVFNHSTTTITANCAGCHGHNGDASGLPGHRHLDGIKYGSGACNNCHGYPPLTAAQLAARAAGEFVNAKVEDYAGGGGHHSVHLLASVAITEGFTPCLPCHPSSTHNQGGGTIAKANVNVNDDPNDMDYRFDSSRTKRYTVATMTCSNISCHFQPTPAW